MLSFTFFESLFIFFKHSALFFFSALQRHPFPWSCAKWDGKTKVCVECEVEGGGFSPERSGLRLEHEILRREASWLAWGKHEAHSLHVVLKPAWRRLVFPAALKFTGRCVFFYCFWCAKISDIFFFFFFKPHDDVRDFRLLDSITSHVQPRRRIKGV